MIFYCRHAFSNKLSICVILIDKSMLCTLSWTFRSSFGLLLKLGAPKNRKLRTFYPLEIFTWFYTKLNFWRNHTLSFLRVALGKQGIYLLLRIGITINLSTKKQHIFPLFWRSLSILFSLHGYFASKTYFLMTWPVYNKVKANIGLSLVCCQ